LSKITQQMGADSAPASSLLSKHFQHHELTQDDSWRSYLTRRNYKFYLEPWIIPRWGDYELVQVRTIEVESWLRSLPFARTICAKSRNLMSVLYNHVWRNEFFDRNPIKLVRHSVKRRTAPDVLIPAEIKLLLDHLANTYCHQVQDSQSAACRGLTAT
jgi:integrase